LTQQDGEHFFSITCGAVGWWGRKTIYIWQLRIDVGAEKGAHAPAKQENTSALQRRVNFLAGKVETMLAEHEYGKTRQIPHRGGAQQER
jgi:hypothetical protein